MGFNLHGLGELISRGPGGKEFLSVVNAVGNPIVQVVSPIVNAGSSMLQSIMGLGSTLTKAAGNVATGVAGFVNSPSFTWVLIGGLGLAGVYLISSGGAPPQMAAFKKMAGR